MDALEFSSPRRPWEAHARNSLWAHSQPWMADDPVHPSEQTSGATVSRKAPRGHLLRPLRISQTLELSTQPCQQSGAHGWDPAQGTRLTLGSCVQNEALT